MPEVKVNAPVVQFAVIVHVLLLLLTVTPARVADPQSMSVAAVVSNVIVPPLPLNVPPEMVKFVPTVIVPDGAVKAPDDKENAPLKSTVV